MTDSKIRELVYKFRSAIEVAYKDGKLASDIIFLKDFRMGAVVILATCLPSI